MSETFYAGLPAVADFDALCRQDDYAALPDDWWIGVADIARSTEAIGRGAYKSVNMVGAAVISAQLNAHGHAPFPYVFGGDGAAFAVPGAWAERAQAALCAVMGWSGRAYGLTLRGAMLPVARVRAAGSDVRVTRYRASAAVDYAMFAGGGLAWAEGELKAGRIGLEPAPDDTEPDLTGLSCSWANMKARNGCIASVIAVPAEGARPADFSAICEELVTMTAHLDRGGHPVPGAGPRERWPLEGLVLERAVPGRRWPRILLENMVIWIALRTGLSPAGFDGRAYARAVTRNADYRKFDDGLKMTLDCDAGTLEHLRAALARAESAGIVRYGISEQDEAMMTCIVPSAYQDQHMHFVDGAAGGYTMAAARMKGGG